MRRLSIRLNNRLCITTQDPLSTEDLNKLHLWNNYYLQCNCIPSTQGILTLIKSLYKCYSVIRKSIRIIRNISKYYMCLNFIKVKVNSTSLFLSLYNYKQVRECVKSPGKKNIRKTQVREYSEYTGSRVCKVPREMNLRNIMIICDFYISIYSSYSS